MALPILAAILVGGSISPAFAAQKVIDDHEETETPIFVQPNPCPEGGFVVVAIATNSFLKVWDNEKFKLHQDAQINLYLLGSGELVGTAPIQTINIQGDFGDLPISGNFNQGGDGECLDGTTFPGIPAEHCGNTLQRSGDLIEHSVSCF